MDVSKFIRPTAHTVLAVTPTCRANRTEIPRCSITSIRSACTAFGLRASTFPHMKRTLHSAPARYDHTDPSVSRRRVPLLSHRAEALERITRSFNEVYIGRIERENMRQRRL